MMEMASASIPLKQKIENAGALNKAIYFYDTAARVARDADAEYAQHIQRFQNNFQLYESHRDGLRALAELAEADRDFLELLNAPEAERKSLVAAAIDSYRKAIEANQLIVLKYYVNEAIAQRTFPQGVTRINIQDKLPADQRGPLVEKVFSFIRGNQLPIENQEDLTEYLTYISRADARLKTLQSSQATLPARSFSDAPKRI